MTAERRTRIARRSFPAILAAGAGSTATHAAFREREAKDAGTILA